MQVLNEAPAEYKARHEPEIAADQPEPSWLWEQKVAEKLLCIDADDITQELIGHEDHFTALLQHGDALAIGQFILRLKREYAEALAKRELSL